MKTYSSVSRFLLMCAFLSVPCFAQGDLTRRVTKTDVIDLGAGSLVSITGAPIGSISISASKTNQVEITADITLEASTVTDLAMLAENTGFTTIDGAGRLTIVTVGSHNKFGRKKLPKKFPAALLSKPFRIDYTIKVPQYTDLDIDEGKGDLSISGVIGNLRANAVETNASIDVIGGDVNLIIGSGAATVRFGTRGWRGRPADVQLATGDLTVKIPTTASADIDAAILKTGSIENSFPDLKERDRKVKFTDKLISAKAGVGGAPLKFTVGEGTIKILPLE